MTPSASQDPDKARSDSPASENRSGTDSHRNDRLQLCTSSHKILEDPEILVNTLISQDSDSECLTNEVENFNLRKHNIFVHIAKCRDCDVCLRTKLTRAPCRRRTGEALPRAEKFGDMVTADHNVLDFGM